MCKFIHRILNWAIQFHYPEKVSLSLDAGWFDPACRTPPVNQEELDRSSCSAATKTDEGSSVKHKLLTEMQTQKAQCNNTIFSVYSNIPQKRFVLVRGYSAEKKNVTGDTSLK